jgi:hypothetical protein
LQSNGQYYFRWLNDFEADGPLPFTSTFDHGDAFSASSPYAGEMTGWVPVVQTIFNF